MMTGGYKGADAAWDPSKPAFELPIYGVGPPQYIDAVNAALTALEQGSFYLPAILADSIMRDDSVMSAMDIRVHGLLGADRDIEPAEDSDSARKAQEDLERDFDHMFPSPELDALHSYGVLLSVGVAQRLTTIRRKSYTPTIKTWNPRNLWYDWLIRKFHLVTENRGDLVIEPDDPEWIVWEPYGQHGWLRRAKLRALVMPWLIRKSCRDWWARYAEVLGQPIRAGIVPRDRLPADERTFLSQISNVGNEMVVRLPQGGDGKNFDLKLIEAKSNNWETFQKLLEFCDKSIEVALLGQSQSTEGQGGLGSQEKAGESTIVRILKGDCRLGSTLRDQGLGEWAQENYGDAELAPYVSWEVEPPEDLEKRSQAFLNMSKGAALLPPEYQKHVDARAVLDQYQVPVLDADKVVEPLPQEDPNAIEPLGPNPLDDEEPPKDKKK